MLKCSVSILKCFAVTISHKLIAISRSATTKVLRMHTSVRGRIQSMLTVAQIFGSNLLRARRQQGLTQKQLGTLTKTSHTFIGEMERGMKAPNLNLVVALAMMLRVSVEELVAGLTPARAERIATDQRPETRDSETVRD